MNEDEKIIRFIQALEQDLANLDIDNACLIQHKRELIEELTQDLIKCHGYKDGQAVWDKVKELNSNQVNRHSEPARDFEKRQAQAFTQEQTKKMWKIPVKILTKKRQGRRL